MTAPLTYRLETLPLADARNPNESRLEVAALPVVLTELAGGQRVLIISKSAGEWLEVVRSERGLAVSEGYAGEVYHHRAPLAQDGVTALVAAYAKGSVADAVDWYPTLCSRPFPRHGHPLGFRLLNERYRIAHPVVFGVFVILTIGIGTLSVSAAAALGRTPKMGLLPVVVFLFYSAKRLDFVDRAKPAYGYKR